MTTQEAAWYLLRQPMSKASREAIFIPTDVPNRRMVCRKTKSQMDEEGLEPDATDIWILNIIQRYEKRPKHLEEICLADFVAKMTKRRGRRDCWIFVQTRAPPSTRTHSLFLFRPIDLVTLHAIDNEGQGRALLLHNRFSLTRFHACLEGPLLDPQCVARAHTVLRLLHWDFPNSLPLISAASRSASG